MDLDLQDLLAAWLGMELSPERQAALLQRLRDEPAFRRAVADEIHMMGMQRAVLSQEPRWLRLADELGRAEPPPGLAGLEARLGPMLAEASSPFVSAWWRPAALAATVIILVLSAVFGAYFLSRPAGTAQQLAAVVNTDNVEWGRGFGMRPEQHEVIGAGRLNLRSGRVTLAFFSGVMLNVEGPADLDLRAMDNVFCRQGHLRAKVPPGAEGFTVTSRGASVIDLGTEFNLDVESSGFARLAVLMGRARAAVRSQDGAAVRDQVVEASRAVEIDPSRFQIKDIPTPDRLVPSPELAIRPLQLPPSYGRTVLASRPRAYWRCESMAGGLILSEVPDSPPLLVSGDLDNPRESDCNHSVAFSPDDATQALCMDDYWAPPVSGFALELWFASYGYSTASIIGLQPTPQSDGNHLALVELMARGKTPNDKPGVVRFLYRWPPGRAGGDNAYSKQIYQPYRWHHLVAQRAGAKLELFIDGALAGQARLDGPESSTPIRLLLGKRSEMTRDTDPRTFLGRMDEIAIYDRPLKPDEIQRHAQAGRGK